MDPPSSSNPNLPERTRNSRLTSRQTFNVLYTIADQCTRGTTLDDELYVSVDQDLEEGPDMSRRPTRPNPPPVSAIAARAVGQPSSSRAFDLFPVGQPSSSRDFDRFPVGQPSSSRDFDNFPVGQPSSSRDFERFARPSPRPRAPEFAVPSTPGSGPSFAIPRSPARPRPMRPAPVARPEFDPTSVGVLLEGEITDDITGMDVDPVPSTPTLSSATTEDIQKYAKLVEDKVVEWQDHFHDRVLGKKRRLHKDANFYKINIPENMKRSCSTLKEVFEKLRDPVIFNQIFARAENIGRQTRWHERVEAQSQNFVSNLLARDGDVSIEALSGMYYRALMNTVPPEVDKAVDAITMQVVREMLILPRDQMAYLFNRLRAVTMDEVIATRSKAQAASTARPPRRHASIQVSKRRKRRCVESDQQTDLVSVAEQGVQAEIHVSMGDVMSLVEMDHLARMEFIPPLLKDAPMELNFLNPLHVGIIKDIELHINEELPVFKAEEHMLCTASYIINKRPEIYAYRLHSRTYKRVVRYFYLPLGEETSDIAPVIGIVRPKGVRVEAKYYTVSRPSTGNSNAQSSVNILPCRFPLPGVAPDHPFGGPANANANANLNDDNVNDNEDSLSPVENDSDGDMSVSESDFEGQPTSDRFLSAGSEFLRTLRELMEPKKITYAPPVMVDVGTQLKVRDIEIPGSALWDRNEPSQDGIRGEYGPRWHARSIECNTDLSYACKIGFEEECESKVPFLPSSEFHGFPKYIMIPSREDFHTVLVRRLNEAISRDETLAAPVVEAPAPAQMRMQDPQPSYNPLLDDILATP